MFPFKLSEGEGKDEGASIRVKVSFKIGGQKLIVEKWIEQE